MDNAQPELENIHRLLMQGFTGQELRDICYYDADLRPVCDQFADTLPKNTLVSTIIAFCHQRMLFDTLLRRAKKMNPRGYDYHGPYYSIETGASEPAVEQETAAQVGTWAEGATDQPAGGKTLHLEVLAEQILKGNVALFIGAGLSMGAGLPGWEDLVQPLAERIGYTGGDPIKAATYYEDELGRRELVAYLRERLDTTGIQPTKNHALLTQLPINVVLTTNYDDLLERAYRQASQSVHRVVEPSELAYWDASKVNLVYLHGTCERPTSIVITETDYRTIYRRNGLLLQKLQDLLVAQTFLFVGYKAGDPDLNQIYDVLQVDLGQHQRRPYLVTFDLDAFERKDLERRGFHVIEPGGAGDYTARLGHWLRALVAAVEKMSLGE